MHAWQYSHRKLQTVRFHGFTSIRCNLQAQHNDIRWPVQYRAPAGTLGRPMRGTLREAHEHSHMSGGRYCVEYTTHTRRLRSKPSFIVHLPKATHPHHHHHHHQIACKMVKSKNTKHAEEIQLFHMAQLQFQCPAVQFC